MRPGAVKCGTPILHTISLCLMRPHEGLNVFAHHLRQAAEAAPRDKLPEINRLLWSAYASGSVTDDEAEALSSIIEARKAPAASPTPVRLRTGSRPRTDASMERRRRWAAAGRLPPQVACRFTLAEVAALAVVTVEIGKRGDCRLHLDAIAAVAGVSRSTVRAALRRARGLGLVTVTERRSNAWRNLSNVVRIVSREWLGWMKLALRAVSQGGGGISSPTTNTGSSSGTVKGDQTASRGMRGEAKDEALARRPDFVATERPAGPSVG